MTGAAKIMNRHQRRKAEKTHKALMSTAKPADDLLASAEKLLKSERFGDAEALARDYVDKHPDSLDGHLVLGRILTRQKRNLDAMRSFERAVALDGADREAAYELASAQRRARRTAAAIAGYEAIIAADPQHYRSHVGLSIALRHAGRIDDARRLAAKAVEIRPFRISAMTNPEAPFVAVIQTLANLRFTEREKGYAVKEGHNTAAALIPRKAFNRVTVFADAFAPEADWLSRLPKIDLLFTIISDSDTVDGAALDRAARLADHMGVPVMNHPDAIRSSTRDGIYERIHDIDGLVMPRTLRVAAAGGEELLRAIEAADLRFPLIVRPTGTQTGEGMQRYETRAAFGEWQASYGAGEFYVAEFFDFRSADGFWRKIRLFSIGGEIIPEHHVAAEGWNIHAKNARVMMSQQRFIDEEIDFISHFRERLGPRRMAGVERIAGRIGLDYFGIDCAMLPDDRLLVFEANASMQFKSASQSERDFLLRNRQNVSNAFAQAIWNKLRSTPQPAGQ